MGWAQRHSRALIAIGSVLGFIVILVLASLSSGKGGSSTATPTPTSTSTSASGNFGGPVPTQSGQPTALTTAQGSPSFNPKATPGPLGPRPGGVTQTKDGLASRFVVEYLSGPPNEAPTALANRLSGLITPDLNKRITNASSGGGSQYSTEAAITGTQDNEDGTVSLSTDQIQLDASGHVLQRQYLGVLVTLESQSDGTWRISDIAFNNSLP